MLLDDVTVLHMGRQVITNIGHGRVGKADRPQRHLLFADVFERPGQVGGAVETGTPQRFRLVVALDHEHATRLHAGQRVGI